MKAFVDTFGVTFRSEKGPDIARAFLFSFVRSHLGPEVDLEEDGLRAWGYESSASVAGGAGRIAWGGNSDTCHLEFMGGACALVADWSELAADLETYRGRMTRCDVAADDLTGETYNVAWAEAEFDSGEGFKPTRGVHPKGRKLDDKGSGDGSTFYVGSRKSGKLFRCYEKGKQLGDPESPWARVEVEYRAVHRELPLQMLTNPSAYLAGAYSCLSELSVEQSRPRTVAYTSAAILGKSIDHARKQAGKILHAMLTLNGGDIFTALSRIYRPELPKRLKAVVLSMVSQEQHEQSDGRYMQREFLTGIAIREKRQLEEARNLESTLWRRRRGDEPKPYFSPSEVHQAFSAIRSRATAGGVPVSTT